MLGRFNGAAPAQARNDSVPGGGDFGGSPPLALQRGRARAGANAYCALGAYASALRRASTGPRPRGRECRLLIKRRDSLVLSLQRGRARAGAE